MELISVLLDFLRNLEGTLNGWAGQMGVWFYAVMFLVIFCETGLVVTPILPGDSLLFILVRPGRGAGIEPEHRVAVRLAHRRRGAGRRGQLRHRQVARAEGVSFREVMVFQQKASRTGAGFRRALGSKTIILARFVPIVRTFAPFVAGIGTMRYPRFFVYNVIGGVAWVAAVSVGRLLLRRRRVGQKALRAGSRRHCPYLGAADGRGGLPGLAAWQGRAGRSTGAGWGWFDDGGYVASTRCVVGSTASE